MAHLAGQQNPTVTCNDHVWILGYDSDYREDTLKKKQKQRDVH